MPTARRLPARLATWSFACLMILAWCGGVPHLMQAAVAQPAPAAPVDTAALVVLLKRMLATAEGQLRKPGADPSDVPAKAAALGFDPGRAFAFVRDEVAYEPYRGVLRGARGALAARAGNALDKSLLLKELLQAGGHDARFVRGQLPDEKARALVDQYLKQAASPPAPGAAGADFQIPADLAEQIGLALPDLQEALAENRRTAGQFITEATAAADVEAKYLHQQLEAAGVKVGRSYEQWVAELRARAADHAWVEVTGADGATTVMDPSFAAGKAGESAPAAAPAAGKPVADLDADRHVVRFRFVYTVKQGERAADQVLIDVPIYADEALYDAPTFSIEPTDPLPPMSQIIDMEPEAVIRLMTGFKNYQAVLRAGGKRTASSAFDLAGNVTEVSADGRVKGAQQLGGATGGLFGGGLGGGLGGGGGKPQNNFVQMSVVMTLESPGAAPAAQKRLLLTQAQTTGDEFVSPILEWKMLVQPQQLTPALNGYLALKNTVGVLQPVIPLLDRIDAADQSLNQLGRVQPSSYPELLMSLAAFRQAATEAVLRDNPSVAALWDRPQVSVAERRFCANAKERRTCGHSTIDLVENALSYVPRAPDAADAAARGAVRQGVFDTVAEAQILARRSGAAGTSGAISVLSAARESGAAFAVTAPADAAALAGTSLSESDRQWIARHEPSGRRVVAPRGAPGSLSSAWWSVDPESGTVVGRRDGGRGQALHEYIVQNVAGAICTIVTLVNFNLDTPKGATAQQKKGAVVALIGCFVGNVGGLLGVGAVPAMASTFTVLNAAIAGVFTLWGGAVARG